MLLIDLPDEIIIIIIRGLDLSTSHSLYNTCQRIRNLICVYGVINQGYMSRNTMATVNTFKLSFFKDISQHLLELNMSGVPDLCKTAFIPALRRLKKLKVLDVSYTIINLVDLIEIHKICPTIKDIAINFSCGKFDTLPPHIAKPIQTLFKSFENVHFIGSNATLLFFKTVLYFLAKSNLRNLKYSVAETSCFTPTLDEELLNIKESPCFEQFTIYLLNWNYNKPIPGLNNIFMHDITTLFRLEISNHEYMIIIIEQFEPKVYTSSIFINFFKENFNITVEDISYSDIKFYGNVAVMIWNKETTNFDKNFFNKLTKKIKPYFPYYFLVHSELHELPVPNHYDWYYTVPIVHVCEPYRELVQGMNKKRRAAPNFVLQYDVIFRDKQRIELSLDFKYLTNNAISLTTGCLYLRKLTFLSLIGLGRYTSDFFNILFRCSENLVTLNVQTLPVSPCASAIARSLPLSRSLKNLRLVDKRIDIKTLFSSFSQCKDIENICIVDESVLESNDLANPNVVLAECNKLYNIYIEAQMSESTRTRTMQLFNRAKIRVNRPYIRVKLQQLAEVNPYCYDPFVDVFRLNPIKQV